MKGDGFMKHLEFKRTFAESIIKGRKKLTIRKWTNLREGDEVFVHSGGKIIGKAKITSIEKKNIEEITDEEAKLDGFRDAEHLRSEMSKIGYSGEVYLIHFEFEPLDAIDPHNLYYGNADLENIAKLSLQHLELTEKERSLLEAFLRYGSIRKAGKGGKRGEIRKILRKCYQLLTERGLISTKTS